MLPEIPVPDNYIGVWEFKAAYGDDRFLLRVDESSTKQELQAEYDYWSDQLMSFDPPIEHKRALWKMLQWIDELIECAVE